MSGFREGHIVHAINNYLLYLYFNLMFKNFHLLLVLIGGV